MLPDTWLHQQDLGISAPKGLEADQGIASSGRKDAAVLDRLDSQRAASLGETDAMGAWHRKGRAELTATWVNQHSSEAAASQVPGAAHLE